MLSMAAEDEDDVDEADVVLSLKTFGAFRSFDKAVFKADEYHGYIDDEVLVQSLLVVGADPLLVDVACEPAECLKRRTQLCQNVVFAFSGCFCVACM